MATACVVGKTVSARLKDGQDAGRARCTCRKFDGRLCLGIAVPRSNGSSPRGDSTKKAAPSNWAGKLLARGSHTASAVVMRSAIDDDAPDDDTENGPDERMYDVRYGQGGGDREKYAPGQMSS